MKLLARLDALADPCAILVDDGKIVLTRRGDAIAAFRNRCPHAGYPLQRHDGRIVVQQDRFLVCGAHGASFSLDDGACAGGPCNGHGLERVAVIVRDGEVWLESPLPPMGGRGLGEGVARKADD